MVKLRKNMKNVNEAKQVGNLYHICTLDALVEFVIPNNELRASGKYYNKLLDTTEAISFTRDSLFVVPTYTVQNAGILFQFEVDGNKLSEKYKVRPYNGNGSNPRYREKEEVVIGPIMNFKSYVKEVRFDIKDLYSIIDDPQGIVSKLKKVYSYLGSIECKRVELPFLDEDDWSVLFSKTKSNFQINTLEDLIKLLESFTGDTLKSLDLLLKKIDTLDLFFDNIHSLGYDDIKILLEKHPAWKKKLHLLLPSLLDYSNRDLDLIEFLLNNNYVDIDFKDSDGNTMLNNACIKGFDTGTIAFLVEHGANVNSKNKLGLTPLMNHVLSKPTSSRTIEYLLDHGAKVNEQDNEGNTALHYACMHNCPFSIINCLIKNGADKELKNNVGKEPMYYLE